MAATFASTVVIDLHDRTLLLFTDLHDWTLVWDVERSPSGPLLKQPPAAIGLATLCKVLGDLSTILL
ncbi:hypothetical protein HYC85_002093 [Camellia sinensis]|uniref:Uncharacterized protein n=1 Tax=Camellia sinensis TaxID=4442 RepID=A0A7J7I909_CAMSI|nr:hypothetical protein HYC85_002093 [Camellia sinensis]